jgi:hypothetical protein
LYAQSDAVRIDNIVDKIAVRSKEAVHFGFPFNGSMGGAMGRTVLDAGYGSMRYLADQLPGSDMDYLYGRRWVDISSADKGLQWMLLETPLVEPGNMIDERLVMQQSLKEWKKEGHPTATWFSYAMNNYWYTNYKADQSGIAHFSYALRPHGILNAAEMEKAASEFTQPLLAYPVKADAVFKNGLFELTGNRIVVTSVTPKEDGSYIIRLFNPEPSVEETSIKWGALQPAEMILLQSGERIPKTGVIRLAGMGVTELLLRK